MPVGPKVNDDSRNEYGRTLSEITQHVKIRGMQIDVSLLLVAFGLVRKNFIGVKRFHRTVVSMLMSMMIVFQQTVSLTIVLTCCFYVGRRNMMGMRMCMIMTRTG